MAGGGAVRDLFPTRLYQAALDDPELNTDLEAAAWMLAEGDEAGQAWCEAEGYDGYTSYASLDDLTTRATAFADLAGRIAPHANAFAEALEWRMAGSRLALDSLWVNILGEGGAHSGHIHPLSVISGVYYVAAPKDAGRLKLEDPRLPLMMAAPPPASGASDAARRFLYLTPRSGDLLMWESWLRHEVVAGRTAAARISISFNFSLAD